MQSSCVLVRIHVTVLGSSEGANLRLGVVLFERGRDADNVDDVHVGGVVRIQWDAHNIALDFREPPVGNSRQGFQVVRRASELIIMETAGWSQLGVDYIDIDRRGRQGKMKYSQTRRSGVPGIKLAWCPCLPSHFPESPRRTMSASPSHTQ